MVRLTLWFVLRDFFRNFFLAVLNVYACRDQARKKIATVTDTLGTQAMAHFGFPDGQFTDDNYFGNHEKGPRNEMKSVLSIKESYSKGGKGQNHKCLWSGPFLIEFPQPLDSFVGYTYQIAGDGNLQLLNFFKVESLC